MSFSDFSSWPRDQEQSFVVYEQRASESSKKALTLGAIAGILFFFLMVGIYAGVEPDRRDITKDMNMSNLTKKSRQEPKAEAPAPAPAEAPAAAPAETPAAAPAEAPASDE
ncbi:MAG TPA: hypothetical protein VFS15_19665 [Kofleriaceae bacterium]|nr:hypothetical protein [Kofleriaceae bacterium]